MLLSFALHLDTVVPEHLLEIEVGAKLFEIYPFGHSVILWLKVKETTPPIIKASRSRGVNMDDVEDK